MIGRTDAMMRIGNSHSLLVPPPREADRKCSGHPSPRLLPRAQRGLDMQRRMGEGRAIRGAWEGRLRGAMVVNSISCCYWLLST